MTIRHPALSLAGGLTASLAALGPCAHGAPRAAAPPAPALAHPALWPKAHSPAGLMDAKTEARVSKLLSQMSLEEKVGQLIQADISAIKPEDLRTYPLGSILAGGNSGPGGDDRASAEKWLELIKAFRAVSTERRAGHTPIPVMFGLDAVHGNNNIPGATIFPHNVGLGAARDPELIREIGGATAEETAVIGADWTFGPTLAVPQDLRWGRTYEGYGENPEIVRAYAPAMVEGVQGPMPATGPIGPGHVAASIKHFLADGGTAGGRDQGDAQIPEAELIRLHAQGYATGVDAGALTAMASYSSWQGVKNHGNRSLLTGVLKGRMGFEGFIVGDWNGHGQVPGCAATSCPQAIKAGLDMYMAPDSWKGLYASTLEQARSGQIPQARLDDAVRRILRVKLKAGLFASSRPLEGRMQLLGSPEHRALARRAVRESLVLLKNNGGLLPLRASARILVAGDGADDIGRQSGGWTISWQGTGNTNADFPHGQSIWSGIREAVSAGGGHAELSADGQFTQKPDVAIVVFGETPYAEFQGDIPTLEYQPGVKKDLVLIKRLKDQGIPVVAVFLSGRPLWTNPEINASDAFVAAWLPGSQGGGVADVLIRKADGRINADFRGKLAYAWPKTAAQGPRAIRAADPQFPYGYGLTYAVRREIGPLSEDPGVMAAPQAQGVFFRVGRTVAPWRFALSSDAVTMRAVDADGQETARGFSWTGSGLVAIAGPPADLQRQANGDMAMAIRLRVDEPPASSVHMELGCAGKSCASLDATNLIKAQPAGLWSTVKVKLSCFRGPGVDMTQITSPLGFSTDGRFGLSIADVALVSNTGDAICP
jgi:beta-glucosidase